MAIICCNDSLGVQLEQKCAQIDIENTACEYGVRLIIDFRTESDIDRDIYTSVSRRSTTLEPFVVYSYPFTPSPNTYQLQKAGIFEEVEYLAYCPAKTFTDNNLTLDDLDVLRATVTYNNQIYNIKDKAENSQLGNIYLYYVLGLYKD